RTSFHFLRLRIQPARYQNEAEIDYSGDEQHCEGFAIAAVVGKDRSYCQRPEHCPELIQSLVQSKCPSVAAGLLTGVRQHDVARRIADGLSDALENDKCG